MNTELLHCFTVKEYHKLGKAGILKEGDRVEFIEGRIVDMTPIGSRHASCVDRLSNFFAIKLQKRVIVRVQSPVQLDDQSEPQPDIVLLKYRNDFYAEHHPTPNDVFLLIEVSESSPEYERKVKIPLYARTGIQEVWLVDIKEKAIEVFRSPAPEEFKQIGMFRHNQVITPQTFPDIKLTVSEIMGLSSL